MKTFKQIGTEFETDKVLHHGYHFYYPEYLEHLRSKEFNMLEIGLGTFSHNTGNSPKLWKQYFPKANIYVMDLNHEYIDEYSQVIQGDQSKMADLRKVKNIIGECNFIIDDGSHHPDHQLLTFEYLFSRSLSPGGVYIIEDIECSYWDPQSKIYNYKTGHLNIIDYFTKYQHEINSEFNRNTNPLNISTITFGPNFIIIKKRTQEEIDFYNREYRFKHYLP
jgi:hypothetical protein